MLNTKTSKRANPQNSSSLITGVAPVKTLRSSGKLLTAKVLPRPERALELVIQSAERFLEQGQPSGNSLMNVVNLFATNLPIAYCRLLLMSSDGESLIPEAAETALAGLKWKPQLQKPLPLTLLPDGPRLSRLGYSLTGQFREPEKLIEYSALLELRDPLTGLLLIPLKIANQLLAVIEFGELPEAKLSENEAQAVIQYTPRLVAPLNRWLCQ